MNLKEKKEGYMAGGVGRKGGVERKGVLGVGRRKMFRNKSSKKSLYTEQNCERPNLND